MQSISTQVKGPKNHGRHHGPTAQSERFPAMSAIPPRPAQTRLGIPTQKTFLWTFSWLLPNCRFASLTRFASSNLRFARNEAIQTSSRLCGAYHLKSDRKHVQYCVNKIETQNKKPIVSSDYPTWKGTHTIGFQPAKLQLFHEPARGWNKKASVLQEFVSCSILEHLNNRHTLAPSGLGVPSVKRLGGIFIFSLISFWTG